MNMKKNLKLAQGFTFIELILYISIVTIMLSALIPFAWNVIEGGSKSSIEQEVSSQARYVSERLKYEIRNAINVNSVNIPANTIDLTTSTNATTIIDLSGGKIRIKYGSLGTPINLNSDDTNVTNLTFINYTSIDNKTKHIGFIFTIASNYSGLRQEFKETITIRGSAEVRSN